MLRCLALLLGLVAAIATAQDKITLDGPSEPVQPREYVQILVRGLTDADLPAAVIDWTPREGTTLLPARLWGGQPFLLFSGKQPGKYTVTVSTNAWRGNLDAAVDAARRAGTIDAESFARLVQFQTDMTTRYPLRLGSCDVEIAGGPPTPPVPPIPVTTVESALILVDSDRPNPQLALALNLLRNNQPLSRKLQILDSRTENEQGQISPLVARVLAYLGGRPLPRLIGLGAGGDCAFDVELPATAATIESTLKQRGLNW